MRDLIGKQVSLIAMRLDEAAGVARWLPEALPSAAAEGEAPREPMRDDLLARWPSQLWDDAYPQRGRVFRIEEGGKPLGALAYHEVWGVPRNARVELVLAGGAAEATGADALATLAAYLFDTLAVARIWSEVPLGDARARAAFEAAGFAHQGTTAEGGRAIVRRDRPAQPRARRDRTITKPK